MADVATMDIACRGARESVPLHPSRRRRLGLRERVLILTCVPPCSFVRIYFKALDSDERSNVRPAQ